MDQFRTACIIHKTRDNYAALLIKEFFKWMGFSYIDYVSYNIIDDVQLLKKEKFHVVVDINDTIPTVNKEFIANSKYIQIECDEDTTEEVLFASLNFEKLFLEKDVRVLNELKDIFVRLHLGSVFYAYTTVLSTRFSNESIDVLIEIYHNALISLKELQEMLNYTEEQDKEEAVPFIEYFLHAKFLTQRKLNELCILHKRTVEYDLEKFLEDIDIIYKYDENFTMVEYQKANGAKLSPLKKPLARFFYERCIEKCESDICTTHYYYDLGKIFEQKDLLVRAENMFELSYKKNSANIKAIFKMGVFHKKYNRLEYARAYFKEIIKIWTDIDNRKYIPLMELEYVCKGYKNIAQIEIPGMKEIFYNMAQSVKEYIYMDEKDKEANVFIKRLYSPINIELDEVRSAMDYRVGICKDLENGGDILWGNTKFR